MTTKKNKLEALREAIAEMSIDTDAASPDTESPTTTGDRGSSVYGSKTPESSDEKSRDFSLEAAREKSYDLLSRRPHTIKELRDKLVKREFPRPVVEAVIERLLELKYIQEPEIAERRALHLAAKGKGPLHIRNKLRIAGLSDATIDAGLGVCEVELDWIERASSWVRKRGLDRKLQTTADQQKLYAKLARRGFPSSTARAVVFDKFASETWT